MQATCFTPDDLSQVSDVSPYNQSKISLVNNVKQPQEWSPNATY